MGYPAVPASRPPRGPDGGAEPARRAADLAQRAGDRPVFLTGNVKGCGRTSLLSWFVRARFAGGSVSRFLSAGLDTAVSAGVPADGGTGGREVVFGNPGDLVLTAESLVSGFSGRFEILNRLWDRTSGEWFACVRILRGGTVPLLGPRDPAVLGNGIESLFEAEGDSGPVLIDGPAGRLTQIASVPGSSFIHVLMVTPGTRGTVLSEALRLTDLCRLPLFGGGAGAAEETFLPGSPADTRAGSLADSMPDPPPRARVFEAPGAVTWQTLRDIPKDIDCVVAGDFTRVFLPPGTEAGGTGVPVGGDRPAAAGTSGFPPVFVRRRIPLLGFVVNVKGMDPEETAADFERVISGKGFPVVLHPFFHGERQ